MRIFNLKLSSTNNQIKIKIKYLIKFQTIGQDCPDGVPVTYVKYSNSAPRSVVQPILLYASTPGVAITAECYNR